MNQEIITQLVKELFESVSELHQEYSDNNTSYVIDTQKEGNKLNITITLNENKDKKEFENWIQNLDDDIYEETIDSLKEEIKNLTDIYESENYKEVIYAFKEKAKEIVKDRINYFQKFLED